MKTLSLNPPLTLFVLGVAAFTSACTGYHPALKTLDYRQKSPVVLSVSEINFVLSPDAHTSTQDPQIRDERVLIPQQDILKNHILTWHKDRFRLAGGMLAKRAQLTMERLSFTAARENLPQGFFEKASSDLYRAEIGANLMIIDENGYPSASAMASVSQTVSVSQNATLAERETAIANLHTVVMNAFDETLTHQIKSHMGSYLAEPL